MNEILLVSRTNQLLVRKGDPSPAQNPMYVDYEDALNSITLLQREFASQEKDIDKLQGTVRVSEAVNKAKDAEIAAKDQEISFLRMKLDLSNTITETVSGLRPAEYKIKPERDVALTVMVLLQRQLKEAEKKCAEYEKIIKGLEAKNSNLTNDVKQKGEARKAADNKAGMEKAKMNDMLGQLRHEKNDLMREITHLKQELALKRISDDDNLYDAVSPKRVKRE